MNELGKPFPKKKSEKKFKEQKIKVEMPHLNKELLVRKGSLAQTKNQGLDWTINGLGKPQRKKCDKKLIKSQ